MGPGFTYQGGRAGQTVDEEAVRFRETEAETGGREEELEDPLGELTVTDSLAVEDSVVEAPEEETPVSEEPLAEGVSVATVEDEVVATEFSSMIADARRLAETVLFSVP